MEGDDAPSMGKATETQSVDSLRVPSAGPWQTWVREAKDISMGFDDVPRLTPMEMVADTASGGTLHTEVVYYLSFLLRVAFGCKGLTDPALFDLILGDNKPNKAQAHISDLQCVQGLQVYNCMNEHWHLVDRGLYR